jgi:RNA polymerase sigma-70 factor (ECF subfamily)
VQDARPEDGELIRRIAAGDREAFRMLFEAYQQPLFRYLARLMRDEAVARELTNDVMIEVWKGAARFEGRAKVRTWVYGIAHNKAVDQIRKRSELPWDDKVAERLADCGPSPLDSAEAEDSRRLMLGLLEQLSPDHRAVIQLTYYEGLSIKEIAEIMSCPEATVKTRMHYARRQLKTLLAGAGIEGVEA